MPESDLVCNGLHSFHVTGARRSRDKATSNELRKPQDGLCENVGGKSQHCVPVDEGVLEINAWRNLTRLMMTQRMSNEAIGQTACTDRPCRCGTR